MRLLKYNNNFVIIFFIMKKEELLEIRSIIEDLNNSIKESYIEELYKKLGNDSIPLVFTNINFITGSFSPKFNVISVNPSEVDKWADKLIDDSKEYFEIEDRKLLKSYLIVCMLAHEIEHSNQKLIADGKKEPKYDYQTKAYKDIYDCLRIKQYLLPRPISLARDFIKYKKYKKNAYDFILERNASIEGFNIASAVAQKSNDYSVLDYLITSRNANMFQGYVDNGDGTLKYTYDKLGMLKEYNKLIIPSDIPLYEKAREGLELTEEERKKVVLSLENNSKFKM